MPGVRILALVGDAFGGHGGMAKFNRDFLTDLTTHPSVTQVVALPRVISQAVPTLPAKLEYRTAAANNKLNYMRELLAAAFHRPPRGTCQLVICGHTHLLPLAFLLRLLTGSPVVLVI